MEPDTQAQASSESVEALMERIQPKLRSLIAHYGIPHHEVDDLLQETFLAFLHKRDSIYCHESWLLGTARKQCLMYLRSHRRRIYSAVDAAVLELMTQPDRPPQEKAEIVFDLNRLLARIPSRCQDLLRLRYRMGYDPAEVAQQMGYRSSSIRKVTSRCLRALTRQMCAAGFFKEAAHG